MTSLPKLGGALKDELAEADKCYIAVALMKDYGLEVLETRKKSCEVKLLVGTDLPTSSTVFEQLISENSVQLRVYQDKTETFHPKVYLLEVEGHWRAYVGSANFTKGGFESNVEMNLLVDEPTQVKQLLDWFGEKFQRGNQVGEKWLNEYKKHLAQLDELDRQRRQLVAKFKKSSVTKSDPLAQYDFTGQFFEYDHHNAFSGRKPKERYDPNVIEERLDVKRRLLDLHDLVWDEIKKKKWDLHPHYESEHIVSSHQHTKGTAEELHVLWLSYNRKKAEIKTIEEILRKKQTPLHQMRLQVLVHHLDVAVHLTVGKDERGELERKAMYERLRTNDADFLGRFYDTLIHLPDSFYINVNADQRSVHSFGSEDRLKEYLLHDDIKEHYFLIGRKYTPDDQRISNQNIVSTTLDDFIFLNHCMT